MKLLRKIIREIILEGPAHDEFMEMWYNREEGDEPTHYPRSAFADDMTGTMHKDMLKNYRTNKRKMPREEAELFVDELFYDKRELKRTWNDLVDKYGSRKFWQGPKMKYFHSLTYYQKDFNVDSLQTGIQNERRLADLSVEAFLKMYKLSGNKDEMSTFGVYEGRTIADYDERKLGFLLSGRVTLVSNTDAFVESRSKATAVDMARHKSSGMPKRMVPTDEYVNTLLFDESDVSPRRKGPGECILDNWSVEALVYSPNNFSKVVLEPLAKKYGIKLLTTSEVFK